MRRFVPILLLLLVLATPAAHAQSASTSTTHNPNVADEPLPDDGADAGGGRPFLILGPILLVVATTLTIAVVRGRKTA